MPNLTPTLRIPYKSADGVAIPTDIYLPSTGTSKPCPVLIMIHGGAFMLGHAKMNNSDQIADCVQRGWIVLAIEHRLCPGVNILEGPMTDVRDALAWAQEGGLAEALKDREEGVEVDGRRVMVMGTSSGGHLALSTAFGERTPPPLAILDFYGTKCFSDSSWSEQQSGMPESFFQPRPQDEIDALAKEKTTFIGGKSLEGQFDDNNSKGQGENQEARMAFAMNRLATGKVLPTLWPSHPHDLEKIDPLLNVSEKWPPTAIVHGNADTMIPMRLSKIFESKLREKGVEVEFIEIEGEPHTFCGKMEKGSRTWDTQRKGFDFLEKVLERSYT